MHITVDCPICRSRYQLDPSVRGQYIRCPNSVCREVFEVPAKEEPGEGYPKQPGSAPETRLSHLPAGSMHFAAPSGDVIPFLDEAKDARARIKPARSTGHVEEVLPVLEAEAVEEAPPAAPAAELSWSQPPPVRNPNAGRTETRRAPKTSRSATPPPAADIPNAAAEPPAPTEAIEEEAPVFPDAPVELPPRAWEAPPVRRSGSEAPAELPLSPAPAVALEEGTFELGAERPRRRWLAVGLIGLMMLLVAGGGVTVFSVYQGLVGETEDKLFAQAQQELADRKFDLAAKSFEKLAGQFSDSAKRPQYEFLKEFSQVRDLATGLAADPIAAYDKLHGLLDARKNDPLLKERLGDVSETLHKLAADLAALAQQKRDGALLKQAEDALADARAFKPAEGVNPAQVKQAEEQIAKAQEAIARWQQIRDLVDRGREFLKDPTDDNLKKFEGLARRAHFEREPEIQGVLADLEKAIRQQVRWVPATTSNRRLSPRRSEPGLLVAPLVSQLAGRAPSGDGVILALARGVLYALAPANGRVIWATRVGIDTTALPVRLPATLVTPELFLVVSADNNTLRALEARTGQPLWEHQLDAPCLGRPVVVGRRAYVPTYDPRGRVYEIEIVNGNVLGHFELGQPLRVGGTWQEGTDLAYFPGDSRNVYVLRISDTDKGCVAILRTDHPSGSLRSEPIVVNRVDPLAPDPARQLANGYLILAQAEGLNQTRLRVWGLPIEKPDPPPLLQPEPLIKGWSWFLPYHDDEKLALASDAGLFSLFGINQVRNEDKALFAEFPEDYSLGGAGRPGRSQVVHAQENDFCVIANGELQRLHYDRFSRKVTKLWKQPLRLGSPLHASQTEEGGKTLFLVTQAPGQQTCLATAVDVEDGQVLWQRQLGLEGQGDPALLGQQVLTVDRGGGLFLVDPSKPLRRLDPQSPWHVGGQRYAEPLEEGANQPVLLPAADGASVYEVLSPGRGERLIVRHFRPGKEAQEPEVIEKVLRPGSPLAGMPVLSPNALVVPLANGWVYRVRLPLDESPGESSTNWRAPRLDENARAYVAYAGGDEYLVTNGAYGLKRFRWPKGDEVWNDEKAVELPDRIVAPPLVLTDDKPGGELRVCVADERGNLTLLQGPDLKPVRTWPLRGKVTAGPFPRGGKIGCVVDQCRLVWIDPAKGPEPLWQYATPGDGIVGQPRQVGDLIVVADVSGRLVGLDPASGKPRHAGYTLQASAAPTGTPVAFGAEQAFVPLTDGTVFLLPLQELRR